MNARLGEKAVRRIEEQVGVHVVAAWAGRGRARFVATGHRHGWVDRRSGEWGFEEEPVLHYQVCPALFPEEAR